MRKTPNVVNTRVRGRIYVRREGEVGKKVGRKGRRE